MEDEDYSFGINLLQCNNVASRKARNDTYTKAYNVFYKLWEDQWGVWLQLILQNILWAFIENQGYTLADVPMFLNPRNGDFRNHIVDNIKYNPAVADFWRFEFFERKEPNQQERVDAALTRINTLLTHPDVRDIVGQQKTTIDFAAFLQYEKEDNYEVFKQHYRHQPEKFEAYLQSKPPNPKVLLFKLSANLASDIKNFIGTMLLSELLHAVRNRPEDKREQCCIFIDEFHNFASSDDMGTLVTEGRKFGVATTIAHVERFGQLLQNQKLQGAMLATANKVFFQLIVPDAEESAPEFAKEVEATEKRREAELVISPRPVEDIWDKGHPDEWASYIRQQYFWLVDLLRKHAHDPYFQFDPARIPPYRKETEIALPKWDAYDDWEMYRATPQMLETGISLLNQYYYDWMQKKYTRKKPATDTEIEIALKVIECFAGVYGFRPTMIPYIPDDMRELYVRRNNDIRDRERERAQRLREEIRRERPHDRLPDMHMLPYIKIENVPTSIRIEQIPQWRKNALDAGFSIHEIDQFIQWQVRPYVYFECERLIAVIRAGINGDFDNPTVKREYDGIMLHEIFDRKNIDPDTVTPGSPLMNRVTERIIWQRASIQYLIFFLFRTLPEILLLHPVKIPSTKYDESLRVERPQHDLVTDMVLELSRLPRYQAYAKIIEGENDVQSVTMQRIHTHPLPKITESAAEVEAAVIENGHRLSKKRDEIEAEIRERQNRWGRGSGGAPPTKQPYSL